MKNFLIALATCITIAGAAFAQQNVFKADVNQETISSTLEASETAFKTFKELTDSATPKEKAGALFGTIGELLVVFHEELSDAKELKELHEKLKNIMDTDAKEDFDFDATKQTIEKAIELAKTALASLKESGK
ncbi:hypothetical protein FACS1894113_5240 [Alphaproteobacteria bacterium]|nr:hypothetical protein FACS1894113_5240 [Alphaproteobacteria bacterium]